MIELKLLVIAACGVLFSLGGGGYLFCRRYIMPVLIGVMVTLSLKLWWAWLMILPVMGTLCLGYSGGKWLVRGAWMALQAFVIGLGLFFTHHLEWYFYVPYVFMNGIAGAFLYDIEQMIGDFVFGAWLGLIVFLIY